jgi:hypothetical protein
MSLPLIDIRIKVSPATDALLETLHRTTGRDKSEIARDVLHKWAEKEIHAAMLLHAELNSKGLLRDYEGGQGQ